MVRAVGATIAEVEKLERMPAIEIMVKGAIRINRIEAITLARAAAAIAGMVEAVPQIPEERKIIVASQYGNTTPHIDKARELLEAKGYEFISFHSIGTGGETLEELLAPGCLDMIQFWAHDTVPERFRDRDFYFHNPNSTLVRTNQEESKELGRVFAEKVNKAIGPTVVAIPLRGWSILDTEGAYLTVHYDGTTTGRHWYDPDADRAFIEALEANLDQSKNNIELAKFDLHINDPRFAQITSSILDDMIAGRWMKGNKYD